MTALSLMGIPGRRFVGRFPAQVAGLRAYYGGAVHGLCLVAVADSPDGAPVRIVKGGVTYAIYLVDPSDPLASPIRVRLPAATRAIRVLT